MQAHCRKTSVPPCVKVKQSCFYSHRKRNYYEEWATITSESYKAKGPWYYEDWKVFKTGEPLPPCFLLRICAQGLIPVSLPRMQNLCTASPNRSAKIRRCAYRLCKETRHKSSWLGCLEIDFPLELWFALLRSCLENETVVVKPNLSIRGGILRVVLWRFGLHEAKHYHCIERWDGLFHIGAGRLSESQTW